MITFLVALLTLTIIASAAIYFYYISCIKKAKNMKLEKGEEVTYCYSSQHFGSVVEDCGDKIKIEIQIPRHLVYKTKKEEVINLLNT